MPVNTAGNLSGINALPFRAVYLIWNEWFRDENLQKSVKIQKGDTNEVLDSSRASDQPSWVFTSDTSIVPGLACPPRGKRHDYFTSALPWTQKGPGVSIGLAGTATLVDPKPVSGYFVQQSDDSLGAAQLSDDGGVHSVYTGKGTLKYQGGYSVSIAGHSVNGAGIATVTAQPGSSWLSKSARYRDWETDRKSTRLNSSHSAKSRMPSSA